MRFIKTTFLTFFFLVFLIFSLTSAFRNYEYEDVSIIISIDHNGIAQETLKATLFNLGPEPLEKIGFTVGNQFKNILVQNDDPGMEFEIRDLDGFKMIVITFGSLIPMNETYSYILSFETDQFVTLSDESLEFRLTYYVSYAIKSFSLTAILPEGYVLPIADASSQAPSILFPEAELDTDGKNLIVKWKDADIPPKEKINVFLRSVIAKVPVGPTKIKTTTPTPTQTPVEKNKTENLFLYLIIAVMCLVLYRFSKSSTPQLSVSPLELLNDDESLLVELLAKHNGIMLQNKLLDATVFSKSKLSRLLINLEERDIIRKDKHGKLNKIILDEKLLDSLKSQR